ncbi:MAG TPA: hypothetical protein VK795_07185 [Terriglobales bacterium]|nr:hypothetical protein [Terriglobales bacterium]
MSIATMPCIALFCIPGPDVDWPLAPVGGASTHTHVQQSTASHNREETSPAITGDTKKSAPITIDNLRRMMMTSPFADFL